MQKITFEEAKRILFEEAMSSTTLGTPDVSTAAGLHLIPYMVYHEVLTGAHRRSVFLNACLQSNDLIGRDGSIIYVPTLDRDEFTAQTASEEDIDNSGFTKTKLAPSEVKIEIGDVVYNATKISDILREDSPSLDWVRVSLKKMGESVIYKIETDIEAALVAGAGNSLAAATAGVLSYDDIVDGKTLMKEDSYFDSFDNPFLLFINPEQEGDLLKNAGTYAGTNYGFAVDKTRQEIGSVEMDYNVYAGCKVYVTEVMRDSYSLIVAPPTHPFGASAIFAWKRHIKSENWRGEQAQYGREVFLLSTRYGIGVTMGNGVCLISNC